MVMTESNIQVELPISGESAANRKVKVNTPIQPAIR